jgi:ABC-2 type transport system permease protein
MNAIYAILLREVKVFFREKERIISVLISPLLFLFVIGKSISDKASPIEGYSYQQFIFPGILVMVVLFTSITYGLYIIWDKRLDFLKEVLVAPVSRTSLFLGKSLGGIIGAMIELAIVLLIGSLFIIPIPLWKSILCFVLLIPVSYMVANIGLSVGAKMKSMEGFGLIMSFLTWPMFFFSGALFEISDTTPVIKTISFFDPMTYAVDLTRRILLNSSHFPVYLDLTVIGIFAAITTFIGVKFFGELQQTK